MSGRRHTVIANDGGAPARPAVDRREALRLLAAGAALAAASCSRPRGEITPWVDQPEGSAQGRAEMFASALPFCGYARGVVVRVQDGRPNKIEGNPRHPFSMGATDPFLEAAILDLFDPQRRKTAHGPLGPSDETALGAALLAQLAREQARRGAGVRVLTSRNCSPTFQRRLAAFQARFPAARVHRWEPVHDDAERAGARLAFGRPLTALPRLQDAQVIVALDADPLGPGPDQIRLGRGYAARRNPALGPVSRLYVLEPGMTATGAMADRRAALASSLVRNAALRIAAGLGATGGPNAELPEAARRVADDAVRDLQGARGKAIVLAGPSQPPEVHALVHWINARLGAPVGFVEPVDAVAEDNAAGLQALARDLHAGAVSTLVVIDANPVYDAPPELGLAEAIGRAPFSLHAGFYDDETARLCRWRLPLAHPLESWSDGRALDGTASLIQPMVAPLYGGRPDHALAGMLANDGEGDGMAAVLRTWAAQAGANADAWRLKVLSEGVIADTAAKPVTTSQPPLPRVAPARPVSGLEVRLQPSPSVWDGRLALNAWLQECPDPLTKEVWGASLRLGRPDAERLGVQDGDRVRLARGGARLEVPVRLTPGQAAGTATLLLGYGRQAGGPVGDGVGENAYALRDRAAEWALEGVEIVKAAGRAPVAGTQHAFRLDGDLAKQFPVVPPGGRPKDPKTDPQPTLLPPAQPQKPAWAMVIDNALCIGCNACVVACQAENNLPVIGADEVRHQRDMHWLRIDRYDTSDDERDPRPGFQPVPCMHCEHAPCEPVCPVEASVHDDQGLNVQVYNRCIGTRFCESNCPYKVRRFNFLDYQDESRIYGDELNTGSITAQRNPEVTVRARGVMEKCTYCVQRIRASESVWGSGPPVTACQAACPTGAIVFGDKADPATEVARLQTDPRRYALLGELGTRPRTTYLARVRNDGGGA
jgi:molybdopterin-containing oxidoreductase family iron-sulfur binding subunit